MRRLLFTSLFVLTVITSARTQEVVRLVAQDASQITLACVYPRFSSAADSVYSFYQREGFSFVNGEGVPQLPAKIYFLPANVQPTGMRILDSRTGDILPGRFSPLIDQPIGLDDSATQEPAKVDGLSRAPFPAQPVELRRLGAFRGNALNAVYFYPLQFLDDSRLQLWESVTVQIQLAAGSAPSANMNLEDLDESVVRWSRTRAKHVALPKAGAATIAARTEANLAQVKISIETEGIYKITYEDLAAAGIEIPNNLDPWEMRLNNKGKVVPFYIKGAENKRFDKGDYLEFFGEANRIHLDENSSDVYLDPYSTQNVYWLEWGYGEGQKMAEEEGLVLETDPRKFSVVYSFPAKVHFEIDAQFDRLSQQQTSAPLDHWFIDGGIFSSEKRDYTISLPNPDNYSDQYVQTRIMLQGQTFDEQHPHVVEVYLNQHQILTGSWFGQTPYRLASSDADEISANFLKKDRNTVTLLNRAGRSEVDNFFINWIEITYPHLLVADKGYLEFRVPPNLLLGLFDFSISGFGTDQISIYKVGVSKIIGASIDHSEDIDGKIIYQAHFQDEAFTYNGRYIAVEESAKLRPLTIAAHAPMDLRSPSLAADYIIIAHESFEESPALKSLVEHRQKDGLDVVVVPLDEIFNQFSDGLFSPYGIKDFLRYAYDHWQPAPRFVLLVGDGSFDNRDLRNRGTNLVPVYMRQVQKYGAAASDHWYTVMKDVGEMPDLYLGRLPVNTEEELAAIVAKTIEYETGSDKFEWLNRLLLIGGQGQVFRDQSEELLRNILPSRLDVRRIYAHLDTSVPSDPFYGGTSNILDLVNDGVFLVNFMGHGGGAIWADNSMMTLEDIDFMANKGRYPIVTSMTCFTGAFDGSYRQTLSETMLLKPEAGAVAVWASSGLGWTWNDFYIVRELFGLIRQYGGELRLGEYLATAKVLYASKNLSGQVFAMLNQYNLLGDPALKLQLPDDKVTLDLSTLVPLKGDSLRVSGKTEFASGAATIEILDEKHVGTFTTQTSVQNGQFSATVQVPETVAGEKGWVRVYSKDTDGSTQSSSSQAISFNGILVDTIFVEPNDPNFADSIRFFANVRHLEPLSDLSVFVSSPAADTLKMQLNPARNLYQATQAIRPLTRGEWLQYYLTVRDSVGSFFESPLFSFQVPAGADFILFPDYVFLVGGENPGLQVYGYNIGDNDAKGVAIKFERWQPASATWEALGETRLDLPRKSRRNTRMDFFPGSGEITLRLTIDPENRFQELDENNNTVEKTLYTNVFSVTQLLGSTLAAVKTDTIAYDKRMRLYVGPGKISGRKTITVEKSDNLQVIDQPDFRPVRLDGETFAYQVSFSDSTVAIDQTGVQIWFQTDSSDLSAADWPQAAVCSFDSDLRKWVRVNSFTEQNSLTATARIPGKFGLFVVKDETPPKTSLSIDGQLYSEGGFVPSQPIISVTAKDANGINRSLDGFKIWIDNDPWDFTQLSFTDSAATLNAVVAKFRPSFGAGQHSVQLQVADMAGNLSIPLVASFKVAQSDEVKFLGNYPNPFKTLTTFAYELSNHADDLEIKIYTTSGRLIRVIAASEVVEDPNPLGPNYHEITWDGRDKDGERVANGLYFFKLKVSYPGKTVEEIGRVVRLQ